MVVKTGVSLPDDLYEKLRRIAEAMGYTSMSRAIRDAVELFIAFNSWWGSRGPVKGVVMSVVEAQRLQQVSSVLLGSSKFFIVEPLDAGRGLLLVVAGVEGDADKIKSLYKKLTRTRGVLTVQPVLVPKPSPAP